MILKVEVLGSRIWLSTGSIFFPGLGVPLRDYTPPIFLAKPRIHIQLYIPPIYPYIYKSSVMQWYQQIVFTILNKICTICS